MRTVRRIYKDRIEIVLYPIPYYRPYIEVVPVGNGNDGLHLLKIIEQMMHQDLLELYEWLGEVGETELELSVLFRKARDLIIFAYDNGFEELSMHVLYLCKYVIGQKFTDFILETASKDKEFNRVLSEISNYIVLSVQYK